MKSSLEENSELSDRDETPLSIGVMVIVICYTQIVLAIVSNVIALYALRCKDISLDDITQLFFKALTIINLVIGVVYPFMYSFVYLEYVTSFTRPVQFKDVICTGIQSFFTAPLVLALLIIVCVNLNKYLMISRPLRYHLYVTPLRVKIAIGVVVIIAIGYSLLFASFPQSPYAKYR